MNEQKSDVILSVVKSTIDQLDEFLKSISKLDNQNEFTSTQATVLERVYLNLIGVRELQANLTDLPLLKSAISLIARAILSDLLTGLIFDHYRNNGPVIKCLNKIHDLDYVKMCLFVEKESVELFNSNKTSEEIEIKKNIIESEIIKEFPDYFSCRKLISINDIFKEFKDSEKINIKKLSTSDKNKYKILKELDKAGSLKGLRTHYIYLMMRVYAQYQHFSREADILITEMKNEETTHYLRVIYYIMVSIEQISSNIAQAERNQIEDLRSLVQKNGKTIASIVNK